MSCVKWNFSKSHLYYADLISAVESKDKLNAHDNERTIYLMNPRVSMSYVSNVI